MNFIENIINRTGNRTEHKTYAPHSLPNSIH